VARYLGPGSASALQADVGAAWRQVTHGVLRQHGIDIEVGQVPLQRAAQEAWLGAGHPALEDLPVVPHTATGDLATGEDEVEPICHLLETLKWRAKFKHSEKMLKTYIEPCEDTESVHPSFSTVVTTGRTSASKPNTQNWPREEGFREMFQARPGHLLGTVDYSGLELVTLAATILHRYGRSQLADAINGGMDVHCKTAADFYGLDYEVVLKGKKQAPYKNMRQQSKAVNFGAPGGLGPPALSEYARTTYGVAMTIPECKAFLDRFKKQIWPDVGLYLRDQGSENRQYDGKLATAYNNMGRMKANCTYTQACNYPFQSLGADAAKWALWNLTRIRLLSWWHAEFEPQHDLARHPLRNSRTVNFVHDEIVMEHPENLAQEAYAEQQRIMVAALGEVARGVKPAVEGALGPNWGH
jgi:DNA polymerase I-like protein with 3'-5' exonuclease and polymerase domains